MKGKNFGALVPATALFLAACGSPEVVPDDEYESVDDLHRAASEAGIECEEDRSDDHAGGEYLRCAGGASLFSLTVARTLPGDPESATRGEHEAYLVSDTWVIGHDDPQPLEDAQSTLGGELITASPLEAAVEDCQSGSAISFDADYDVATITGAFRRNSEGSTEAFSCLVDEIPVPDHVQSDIDRTRALDGTRDASWQEYEASWTYHPDSGLNIQITYTGD